MTRDKHWRLHEDELARIVGRVPFGLITDIDGTISPIAATPGEAHVTQAAREALRALVGRVRLVAAVTGRGAADAHRMVGVPGVEVVGSHGLERWRDGRIELAAEGEPYLEAIRAALEEVQSLATRFGMSVEAKGITASIHYRNAPNRERVRDAVYPQLATIAARHGLELFEGRYILELHPPLEVNKGSAVRALVTEFGLSGVVFLGDDVTDVNAFRALRALRDATKVDGAALGVVSDESPAAIADEADFTLEGVPDVESFLGWLLETAG